MSTAVARPKHSRQVRPRPRSGIYPAGSGWLLVPTDDMWLVHEASKPSKILRRAKLPQALWNEWRSPFSVQNGIGGHTFEEFFELLYSGWRNPLPEWVRGEFDIEEVNAFRKESSLQSIARAARRTAAQLKAANGRAAKQNGYKPHVSASLINTWLEKHGEHAFFKEWLIRGTDSFAGVTIVSAPQRRRCSKTWDFTAHCRRSGKATSAKTYLSWLPRLIPTIDWLKWQYGYSAPKGAFVINAFARRLRTEMSREGISKAAGLFSVTVLHWKKDPVKSALLESLIAIAAGPGPKGDLPVSVLSLSPEQAAQVNGQEMENMWAYALHARRTACCNRAAQRCDQDAEPGDSEPRPDQRNLDHDSEDRRGRGETEYYRMFAKADVGGVRKELEEYLNCRGNYGPHANRKYGVLAPNFYSPAPQQIVFRKIASAVAGRQRAWQSDLTDLPGFDRWFADCTAPQVRMGERRIIVEADISHSKEIRTKPAKENHAESSAPTMPVSPPSTSATSFQGDPVILGSRDDFVMIRGIRTPPLSDAKFDVVKALIEAGDAGLSNAELEDRSGRREPVAYLRRLRRDPRWRNVIEFPGGPWGRYRIKTVVPDTVPDTVPDMA